MTIPETRLAVKLLGDKVERSELASLDRGGYCVSVVFVGGWSRVFCAIDEVRQWCLDHEDQ
jgi:hypothetical protein